MKTLVYCFFAAFLLSCIIPDSIAQENNNTLILKGKIIDANTQTPLPFANIGFYKRTSGSVSNEEGFFSLPIPKDKLTDSLIVQFIGYKTYAQALPITCDTLLIISLTPKTTDLQEAMVYAEMPKVESILENLIARLEKNYKPLSAKVHLFYRQEQTSDLPNLSLKLKKNNIPEIDQTCIQKAFDKIPRHSTSFSDLLCKIYLSENKADSLKIVPERFVRLKDVQIDELESLGKVFNTLLSNTKDNEYWKIRTGIFSQKMTIDTSGTAPKDGHINIKYTKQALKNNLSTSQITDNKLWDFIYKPKRYEYKIEGMGCVNKEEVFIISFHPNKKGLYQGKLYISTSTYALLRADYKYGNPNNARHFNLLGISYKEEALETSIMFMPYQNQYRLKFLSRKRRFSTGINRDILFLKKRKRMLLDKTIYKTKTALEVQSKVQDNYMVLVYDFDAIPQNQYTTAKNQLETKVIEIEQYDENLWEDYPNIAPESYLRAYKKQGK